MEKRLDPKIKHWTITMLLALLFDAFLIGFVLSLTACEVGQKFCISTTPISAVHDEQSLIDKRK